MFFFLLAFPRLSLSSSSTLSTPVFFSLASILRSKFILHLSYLEFSFTSLVVHLSFCISLFLLIPSAAPSFRLTKILPSLLFSPPFLSFTCPHFLCLLLKFSLCSSRLTLSAHRTLSFYQYTSLSRLTCGCLLSPHLVDPSHYKVHFSFLYIYFYWY